MRSPVRPDRVSSAALLALLAMILATLTFAARAALADPPPPFIIQVPASMSSPSGIATDAAGNVYVADTGNNRVLEFSSLGSLINSWGTLGAGNGQFNQPWGVAVTASNVFVGDSGNNRVQKFTTAGAFVSAWAVAGAHGVATDGAGNVYVSGTSAIGKYTNAGGLMIVWGAAGAGNGQFNAPLGVAVDALGSVYVADTNNGRIQRFTSGGGYLGQWGGLTAPDGVCVDNGGHVIVAETGGFRMDAYTNTGVLISQWGTQGSGSGQFQLARAVTTNSSGNVFVLDTGNLRLQVFGTVTTAISASGANPSVFGQSIPMTANVLPTTVSATVYFKDGVAIIGPAALIGGVATLGVSTLTVGSHVLSALYSGDANSAASNSPGVTQQVNQASSSTVVAASLNPSGVGQSVTFTATVTAVAPGAGTPTGGVTFYVNGSPTSLLLVGGMVSRTLSALATGTNVVSASYGGDTNFLASASAPLGEAVLAQESGMPIFKQWGSTGTGSGQFQGDYSVAVAPGGQLYVGESSGNRIQEFDSRGTYLTGWGTAGSGNGQFNRVVGVAVDAAGNVYAADWGNYSIQKFTSSGAFLTRWGVYGTGNGQFNHPNGVAVDAAGNVFVTDSFNNRIQKFTSAGVYLSQWGTSGAGDGQFNFPQDIAVAPNGNVYVTELDNLRVQEFTGNGAFVAKWGSLGIGNGQFKGPRGIAVGRDGAVYVTDTWCGCVQKFTSGGAYLSASDQGTTGGTFQDVGGPAVNQAGDVFVADGGYSRVLKFSHLQRITAVTDVGNDQGHQVRIRIAATGADTAGSYTTITGYEVYRQIVGTNGQPLASARRTASPSSVQREGWDYVMTIPARGDSSYFAVVPTLADSAATGMHWSTFFASATTSSPTTNYYSGSDSGYSVDNLPPAVPAPFTAAYAQGATALHWGRSTEPDLWYYRVYRGGSAGFVPSPGNLVATRSDTGYVDAGAAGSYYKLSAVDVAGNESGYATLTPGGTLDAPEDRALSFALTGLLPNPASGARMNVQFVLAVAAPARLELLDVSGRRVAVREVGSFGAGRHSVDLAAGRRIAPGLYLVRLSQGTQVRTLRAVVLD